MHKRRILVACIAGAGVLGGLLPWLHAPFVGQFSGDQGDGIITIVLFALAILMITLPPPRAQPPNRTASAIASFFSGAAALIGIWDFFRARDVIEAFDAKMKGNPFGRNLVGSVSIGSGLYLTVAAGLAAFIVGVVAAGQTSPSSRPQRTTLALSQATRGRPSTTLLALLFLCVAVVVFVAAILLFKFLA